MWVNKGNYHEESDRLPTEEYKSPLKSIYFRREARQLKFYLLFVSYL